VIFLPITIVMKFFKVGGSAGANLNKAVGVSKGVAKKSKIVDAKELPAAAGPGETPLFVDKKNGEMAPLEA
jgi:hypothetical protein